jgi:hypothetical protein
MTAALGGDLGGEERAALPAARSSLPSQKVNVDILSCVKDILLQA